MKKKKKLTIYEIIVMPYRTQTLSSIYFMR